MQLLEPFMNKNMSIKRKVKYKQSLYKNNSRDSNKFKSFSQFQLFLIQ